MPWAVHVDPKGRVSYVLLSGIVTFQDVADAQTRLAADPAFDPRAPLVIDIRHGKDLRLTWSEIHQVIDASPLLDSTRRAVVAGEANVLGTARVYEVALENKKAGANLRIFKTLEDAAEWLGVSMLNP